jgi:dienelactone hydrolase
LAADNESGVTIRLDGANHAGQLAVPAEAAGVVVFAHGSGSSRLSPRNRFVADYLHGEGIATLLFDLLTEAEDRDYETRFDIDLLTHRLLGATHWLTQQAGAGALPIGYFGASTGSAAALKAAADNAAIKAVVSRGGRPDLAIDALPRVQAPTLLIVGGNDDVVIGLNRRAYEQIMGVKVLEIVPGATHLFEEPGTLEQVAHLAADWFSRYLGGGARIS